MCGKHRGEKNFCDSGNDKKFEFMTSPAYLGFPGGSDSKESTCNAGDLGSIPGLERSLGGEDGSPVQYCLESFIDSGAWQDSGDYGVAESWTRLSG